MIAKAMVNNKMFMKYIALIICLLMDINAHAAEMPAIAKDHCGGCHAVEKTLYAPSLKAIAMKYRGDADAANKLTEIINRGGTSGWNSGMRMPPRGLNANDKEIKAMVEFIIELSTEDSGTK
ncbi:MAG: c-type cytochrome [Gallionella sp.]|nr:c-type cytochrome [Gallionella sp.]